MSVRRLSTLGLAAAFSFALVAVAAHQAPAPAGAQFTISGTSTVRAWSCPAKGSVRVTPGQSAPAAPGLAGGVQTLSVTVPVKAIECDTDLMNTHLQETLGAQSHPDITYELSQYAVAGDVVKATGNLTIAGVTRPVTFDVRLAPSPQGVRATGDTAIDLTQFSVTPPAVFEGMLKVGKDVRIRFETNLISK